MKTSRLFSFPWLLTLIPVLLVCWISIKKADRKGFALIELYTSEGCSSCPPADALVAKTLAGNQGKEVYVLAYHVDYWNRLGWEDKFSKHEFSERQSRYARQLHSQVYTPQIIVNGKTAFVGSDKSRLQKYLKEFLSLPENNRLSLTANFTTQKKLSVHYQLTKPETSRLQFVFAEKSGQSNVKSGENAGRVLKHVNIVTELKTIEQPGKTGEIDLSADLAPHDLLLTGFAEDKRTGAITAICQIDLNSIKRMK